MLTVKDVLELFSRQAPLSLAEDYDNVGLLIGSPQHEVTGILCTLEVTAEGVQAAQNRGCDLIVSHHPLIFRGIKRIDPHSLQGSLIKTLLRHNIAVIALHTNWDRFHKGTSFYMGHLLGLEDLQVLAPEKGWISLLAFTVPASEAEQIRKRLNTVLRPVSARYDSAAQWWNVTESYRPVGEAQSRQGTNDQLSEHTLSRLLYLVNNDQISSILTTIRQEHPYEEFWHEIYPLENTVQTVGFGCIGNLKESIPWMDFIHKIKDTFGCPVIRHSRPHQRLIKRVAFCGGSGISLYPEACRAGADVFITADVKYHDLAEASPNTVLADIGHYESEYRVAEQFAEILKSTLPVPIPVEVFHPEKPVFYS